VIPSLRPSVFDPSLVSRDDGVAHFRRYGWVVVQMLDDVATAQVRAWVDEIAALPDGAHGVMQHFERTDAGVMLCRSEHFVPFHAALTTLLCTGPFVDVASAVLGEPALLYKEKINYKLAGGAGFSPHQDAPAYPLIDRHVSAMVAVDDADETNGCLEVVSGWFDEDLPVDERGCLTGHDVERLDWVAIPLSAGQTLWFDSRTPHRSPANRSDRSRRAIYPTYNAAREGDLRADYYAAKQRAFAEERPEDRVRLSLIGDFEGRPV
jgi:2-aminoethylphosphonate dioxygenase